MEKRVDSEGSETGGVLKRRLRGIRKRKEAQPRPGWDTSAVKARLMEARRRIAR